MQVCEQNGIESYMVTMWTNGGAQASNFMTLPALYLISEYNKGNYVVGGDIDKEKFKQICGVSFDDMWALEYIDDPFKRIPKTLGNRSYWILMSDILSGNYDMILSPDTGEKYLELAEYYKNLDAGDFRYLFDMASALADMLSLRCLVPSLLRDAYKSKNNKKLIDLKNNQLKQLIDKLENFISVFERYWLKENYSFGLDYNHYFLGGQLERCKYVVSRIDDYINNGTVIDELEVEILKPSIVLDWNEDECEEYLISKFMQYTTLY